MTGGGLRALGSSAPILATPAPGYLFARWDGAFAGQPASFTHLVASSLQATAVFEQDATDADGDGLSAYEETVVYGTNPALRDTDGDGLSDGDEARVTYTDPLQDDAALIRRIAETFGPGYAGGMALETTRIASDSGAVARVLLTGLRGSADLLHWNPVPLAPPDIALTPSGLRVQLAVPAPTNTVPVYLLHGYPP